MPSDDFTGTNNDPLSANWTTIDGTWKIFSNMANCGDSGTFVGAGAIWNGGSPNANQFSEIVLAAFPGSPGAQTGALVRGSAGPTGYFAAVDETNIYIQRWDGNESYTILQTISSLTIAQGDTIRLEISGTTLKAFQNGTQRNIGTEPTDATYASGRYGIFGYNLNLDASIDSWTGGDLAGGETITVDKWLGRQEMQGSRKWIILPSGTVGIKGT